MHTNSGRINELNFYRRRFKIESRSRRSIGPGSKRLEDLVCVTIMVIIMVTIIILKRKTNWLKLSELNK